MVSLISKQNDVSFVVWKSHWGVNSVTFDPDQLWLPNHKVVDVTPRVAQNLNSLALSYRDQDKYAEAQPLYEQALAIRERVLSPDHPDVATSLNNLALLYSAQGKYDEALPLYQRAVNIAQTALGADHPTARLVKQNLKGCEDAMRKR